MKGNRRMTNHGTIGLAGWIKKAASKVKKKLQELFDYGILDVCGT